MSLLRCLSFHLRSALLTTTLLGIAALLPSCAYMQTHKSVREMGTSYKGYKLDSPRQLYRSGSTWYVAATPAEYRLSHDYVHDNVFHKTHEPFMKLTECSNTTAYHALSEHSAAILLREDGYMDTSIIAQELMESTSPWLSELPHATAHKVRAQIAGEPSAAVTYTPAPNNTYWLFQGLAGLDFLAVDVPGTAVYNVAVPFMTPFVFFYEFLSE